MSDTDYHAIRAEQERLPPEQDDKIADLHQALAERYEELADISPNREKLRIVSS